jgi:prophage maintenance system killer protein
MAFFLTDVFLRMNGYRLGVRPRAGYDFILEVLERKEDRFRTMTSWITRHIIPNPS